ncbi:response regulator transcription factor [Chryseobacterium soli]|uniref:response regulator transcription factor n=1 Tax=Chryseobacterium soli TaxID=445961 RepID=UPI0029538726|nr:response regulator transcription factor [Chryseobacterium soli]MDV7697963.1 response regulator transcription factor [Chryseobacterium soli]
MKILLIDDHAIINDGLTALLEMKPDFKVTAQLNKGPEALEYLEKNQVDLIISDYNMSGIHGSDLILGIKKLQPSAKIIILSMHDEAEIIREVMNAGADAYVLKKYAKEELFTAIEKVRNNDTHFSSDISKILLTVIDQQENKANQFTTRELEVLRLLVKEHTNKEIAQLLFISERTVEAHRKSMMIKTKTSNAFGLLQYVYSNKILK